MFKLVPAVGALMIIQGLLEIMAGAFATLYGLFYGVMAFVPFAPSPDGEKLDNPAVASAFLGGTGFIILVFAAVLIALGLLKGVAGFHTLRYRKRNLALAAAFSAPIALLTCYCGPTGVLLGIFACIVLLDRQTQRAFELGERGATSDDIYRELLGTAR